MELELESLLYGAFKKLLIKLKNVNFLTKF
jgi:hypothetical protein